MALPWYELACGFVRAPDVALGQIERLLERKITRQQKCSLRAIARLHPLIGESLDKMGADWNVARRVAHAPGPAKQRERAIHELAALKDKRKGKRYRLGLDLLADLENAPGLERILAKTRPTLTAKEVGK